MDLIQPTRELLEGLRAPVLASFLDFMRRSREGIRKSLKAYPRIRAKEPQP